ncbi:MAG: NYN domain-containing protein, partial [Patescibacteria group bacterium]
MSEKWDSHRPRRHVAAGSLSSAAPERAEGFYARGFSRAPRIAVFIDAANLEKSVEKLGWKLNHKYLKNTILALGRIVHLGYFTVVPKTQAQEQFLHSLSRFGFRVYTKPLKIIKTPNGDLPKADVDAEIITEMMERQNDYDVILLFSGDSDYRYPLKLLQAKGKKVIIVSTRYSVSKELLGAADRYVDMAKIRYAVARGQIKSPSFATGGKSNLATALLSIVGESTSVKRGLWTKVYALTKGQEIAVSSPDGTTVVWEHIVSIERLAPEQVYDIEIADTHNFIGNDIVAHNTYISSDLSVGGNDISLGTGTATTTLSGGFGIGVGTTTPGAAFAVATSTAGVNTAFLVSNLGSGYTAWFEDAANDTSPFVIQADGNVGIGTTSP